MSESRIVAAGVLVAFMGLALCPSSALAQPRDSVATAADETARERATLPHPVVMQVIKQVLGDKAPSKSSLEQSQVQALRWIHESFDKDVKEFLRTHAGKDASTGASEVVPSREDVEQRLLAVLKKDQRTLVESALNDAAAKRVSERHSSSHHDSAHPETKSGDGTSSTSSRSESSSSSDSRRQSSRDSHSSSDKHSDKQSRSDTHSDSDQHKTSDQNKGRESVSSKTAWSKLDTKQQKATVLGLLDQLESKDREALARELNIAVPAPK